MYCMYCGKEIADASVFCSFCGKKQSIPGVTPPDALTEEQPSPTPKESQASNAPSPKKKKTRTALILAAVIAAVTLIAALIFVIASISNSTNDAANNTVIVPSFSSYIDSTATNSYGDGVTDRFSCSGKSLRMEVFEYIRLLCGSKYDYACDDDFYISDGKYMFVLAHISGDDDTEITISYVLKDERVHIAYGDGVKSKNTGDIFTGLGRIPDENDRFYKEYIALLISSKYIELFGGTNTAEDTASDNTAASDNSGEGSSADVSVGKDPAVLPNFLSYDNTDSFKAYWSTVQVWFYKSGRYELTFTSEEQSSVSVVSQYVDALKSLGYSVVISPDKVPTQSTERLDLIWVFYHPDVKTKAVNSDSKGQVMLYGTMHDKGFDLTVITRRGITVEGYEEQYASYDSYTLPDFLQYDKQKSFAHKKEVFSQSARRHCQFTADSPLDAEAVYDYIEALCDMGYTVDIAPKKTVEEAAGDLGVSDSTLDWYLYHPDGTSLSVNDSSKAQVVVHCLLYEDGCTVDIVTCGDITVENYEHEYDGSALGDKGTVTDDDDSNRDDNSGGNYEVPDAGDRYNTKTPCTICNNGNCRKCGGDGYVYSSASGKDDRNCTGAYCNSGRCTNCGGDGWRD